jgi:Protein of unknown function (DUF3341)
MSNEVALISTFGTDEECAHAMETLHAAQVHDFQAISPFPSEKIIEAYAESNDLPVKSPLRWWVLCGGITGFLSAIALTVGTSWEWNINVGGRPIASIPPYVVIMFELMILLGGISGVLGFFVLSRLPAFDSVRGYRSRFGADKFGLVVLCNENEVSKLESLLRDAGAEDVAREAA